MVPMTAIRIERGFPEHQRGRVAELFWEAFSPKLGRIMAPEAKALDFIVRSLSARNALTAQSEEGRLLGVAGFKTGQGGLINGGLRDLARSYGWLGALWRGPLLDLTDRPLRPGQLLMDGLFVDQNARGAGVGSALIDAVVREARERGLTEVRLDVVDTNPRARALYERYGFVAVAVEDLGPLTRLFSFRRSTTMCLPVTAG
jgi:ribosomal protein S18 acetylase RimI-like enzyme